MSQRRLILTIAIVAFLAAILFPALIGLLTDWWWFQEIGYQTVFFRPLLTSLLLFVVVGGITFGVLYGNLRLAQRGLVPYPVVLRFAQNQPRVDLTGPLRRVSLPVSLVVALIAGFGATPAWDLVLRFIYRTPFGIRDPVFSRDIGFYVFSLPALSAALAFLSTLALISLVVITPVYVVRGDILIGPGAGKAPRLRIEPSAGTHIAALLSAEFLLLALRLWLVDTSNLLYSTTGPLVGASYTDLHATLPALRILSVVSVIAAVAVIFGAVRRELGRYALLAIGAYLVTAIIGRGLVPSFVQKFLVSPTELTRETPYLRSHILATRQAWGLDSVETRELTGETNLTMADIRANAPTIDNVRLWDRDPLLQTFGQLQEIRTYYDFVSVDDDRYWIDGKYRQVLLSPRELNVRSLPTRTFINEHLTFTHGMGLTLSPVNQVTTEGLPVLFIKDLPPVSTTSLKVSRPQLYYGEMANDYVFVDTRQREFDHPSGEKNVYASYAGKGGVPVRSLIRRAVLAAQFGSSKILFSGDITDSTRVLYNRDIVQRARKALPFVTFDRDPYLVVANDGTLKWILDGYTSTTRYPYAERLRNGISYMRNSVKLVVDAYDGTLMAYVSAPGDPIIRTWSRVFPGIFTPLERMPRDIRSHIRYPDQIYRVQAGLYTTYHMDDPVDFYHREDQWQIPEASEAEGKVPFMRHIVMRLPEEKNAEYIYMVPFTPRGKDNLAAWMAARNDGAEYGRLRVYRLSRQSLAFGPQQIVNRINQNTEVSQQLTLWDQRGSQVIRGDLLVIPIEEALMYVQPIYLRAEGGRIPELKRVVVAYQNRVVMRETLEQGLAEMFGGGVRSRESGVERAGVAATADSATFSGSPTPDSRLPTLLREAKQHYQAAIQAQRDLDWARYGEEMRLLGEILNRVNSGPSR
ncbi:MAG: UPF0182 family protein [Gemmatimonadales bacterium]